MNESRKGGHVGRIEDDDDVLHIGAVGTDVAAEFGGDQAVAPQQVLAGHPFPARGASGRNDVFGILESLFRIDGRRHVDPLEAAVVHLGQNAFHSGLVNIIQAYVRSQSQHQGRLSHVGADHSAGTDNGQFLIRQKTHCSSSKVKKTGFGCWKPVLKIVF